jgi:enolase
VSVFPSAAAVRDEGSVGPKIDSIEEALDLIIDKIIRS